MLQYRGKNAASEFYFENSVRQGESLCSISGCCSGVDLECFGCHPGLLEMGIPCEEQPTETNATVYRDCFCDTSCILFEDCCDDHFGACADELYIVSMLNQELLSTKLFYSFQIPETCLRPEHKPGFNSKLSCELRGSCCSGGDLACFGCDPVLLAGGIPCELQKPDTERDCYCDKSCILFQARVSNQEFRSGGPRMLNF